MTIDLQSDQSSLVFSRDWSKPHFWLIYEEIYCEEQETLDAHHSLP